ncbi:hypothetical protein BG004_002874, partial [Podila humilis]
MHATSIILRSTIARSRASVDPSASTRSLSLLTRNHALALPPRPPRRITTTIPQFRQSISYRAAAPSEQQLLSSSDRTILATTRAIRNILLFSTSTLALGFFLWSGSHAYLEQYKCPSPPGASSLTQKCLHGAWVREEISPEPDVAEIYYNKAIELTRTELLDLHKKLNSNNQSSSSSSTIERELELERDLVLAEIQNRLARFYARIGQDERAATIWTRLWKLSDKGSDDREQSVKKSASEAGIFSSVSALFGGASERPLMTRKDGARYAKSAADCWMRMGEYEMAEEALGWILSNRTQGSLAANSASGSSPSTTPTNDTSIEEIGLWSQLGALYVRQKKFDYALSLFARALQSVQAKRSTLTEIADDNDLWFCREAILMNSIGETLLGTATFNTSSLSSSSSSTAAAKIDSKTTAPPPPPPQQQQQAVANQKSGSSWKFWSNSSSLSSSPPSSSSTTAIVKTTKKSAELIKKEEEALGWMQKAIAMAKEKSGKHRDCDECAGLALNTL